MRTVFLVLCSLLLLGFTQPNSGATLPPHDQGLFKPSKNSDTDRSRELLLGIYLKADKHQTLFCGCSFNASKSIDPSACGYVPRKSGNKRSGRLEWGSVIPAFQFGKVLLCWRQPICKRYNGRPFSGEKCCSEVSTDFKLMESDMHNLFPAIGEIRGDRANYPFGEIRGEKRKYGQCDFEIKRKVAEPAENIRGDIARAYFYMSYQYHVPLLRRFEDMLRRWHVMDPPDGWEMDRNALIEEVQGNRNPFIDHPELAERIKDF